MSALTEICRDLFAPRPTPKLGAVESAKAMGCVLVLALMFVAMVAPWFIGIWALIHWVHP